MDTKQTALQTIPEFDRFVNNLSKHWKHIYLGAFSRPRYNKQTATLCAGPVQYEFMPYGGHSIISKVAGWIEPRKLAAIKHWYEEADPQATWIIDYFDEYKRCIDVAHTTFRSNYGVYVYTMQGLNKCCAELLSNPASRRACIVINDRDVMLNDGEIDKLCTNAIHYFIHGKYLRCVVQMRSSNMVTLFPYDVFMFSVFFMQIWQTLKTAKYDWLEPGTITMQVADAHLTVNDIPKAMLIPNEAAKYDENLVSIAKELNSCLLDNERPFIIDNYLK